jgi:predicted DNA-binding mobile mystery protein A
MTTVQLARRLKISQPTVVNLEKSEEAETISLKSLRKMAEAMDCSLVYAFVPHESLEKTLMTQAQNRAAELTSRVEHSMQLEAQGRSSEEKALERQELAEEMVRTLSRDLWEGEDGI